MFDGIVAARKAVLTSKTVACLELSLSWHRDRVQRATAGPEALAQSRWYVTALEEELGRRRRNQAAGDPCPNGQGCGAAHRAHQDCSAL